MGSLLMSGLQYILRSRVVCGNEWHRTQVTAEIPHPDSAHCEGNHDVSERDVEGLRKAGLNVPEQIDIVHHQHPGSDPDQARYVALDVPEEQHEKWHEEMEDDEEQADVFPAAMQAAEVPRDFVGQVAGP